MTGGDPRHGTPTGYNRIPCREKCCREAKAAYENLRRREKAYGRNRKVPILGTRRRVEALCCIGWPMAEVARRSGLNPDGLPVTLGQETILATTAAKIAKVYEELCMKPAEDSHSASLARGLARRRGYAPPLAWDDIDNDLEPVEMENGKRTRAQIVEDFNFLVSAGESEERSAERVGIDLETILDYRRRGFGAKILTPPRFRSKF